MPDELDAAVDRELRRRSVPPYRPDWRLIGCRACGRRIYDDYGHEVHRWWWDWFRRGSALATLSRC
jgi:hypothetical protein